MTVEVIPASHGNQEAARQNQKWVSFKITLNDLISTRPPGNLSKTVPPSEDLVMKCMEGSSHLNHTELFLQMAGTRNLLEEE